MLGARVTLGAAAVGNEQVFFVCGKRQAIGMVKVMGDLGDFQGVWVNAVDVATVLFHAVNLALVVGNDAVVGVGEPNGMI